VRALALGALATQSCEFTGKHYGYHERDHYDHDRYYHEGQSDGNNYRSDRPSIAVVNSYPDTQFILPVMGWPIDLTEAGHRDWKRDMEALSSCENVAVKDFRDGMHLRP
jgi:hypothetical protein